MIDKYSVNRKIRWLLLLPIPYIDENGKRRKLYCIKKKPLREWYWSHCPGRCRNCYYYVPVWQRPEWTYKTFGFDFGWRNYGFGICRFRSAVHAKLRRGHEGCRDWVLERPEILEGKRKAREILDKEYDISRNAEHNRDNDGGKG